MPHKKEMVHLNDLVKYSTNNSQSRKRKSTDFFVPLPDTKIASTELSNDDDIVTGSQVENMFYSVENLSKLCAEGAIGNLMNVLHCSKQDIDLFWSIVTSPVQSILHALNEKHVPKAVQRGGIEIDRKVCGFFERNLNLLPQVS